MPFTTNVLGALTVALALTGSNAGQVFESSNHCTIKASSYSKTGNDKARAKAAAKASEILCKGKTSGDPHAIAYDTATAFAEAVAQVSIACTIKGKGEVKAAAKAKAKSEAEVWLRAWAKAVSTAKVCGKCKTFAEAEVKIIEEVILKAVAKVDVAVHEKSDGGKVEINEKDYEKDLQEAVVTAYAEAFATATDDDGVKCSSQVDTIVETPDSGAECWSINEVYDDNSFNDAIVSATATASASSCTPEGLSVIDSEQSAKGVATAVAKAFASVLGGCETEGNGYACLTNHGWIKTVSKATAEATAAAWVDAMGCDCEIDADVFVQSLGGVIADAATDIYVSSCKGGGKSISQDKFKEDFEKLSVKAVAKLFIDAYVNGDKCSVDVTGETEVCQCVDKWKPCIDEGKVLGCCDHDFSCIKTHKNKPDSNAHCRPTVRLDEKDQFVALEKTCGKH